MLEPIERERKRKKIDDMNSKCHTKLLAAAKRPCNEWHVFISRDYTQRIRNSCSCPLQHKRTHIAHILSLVGIFFVCAKIEIKFALIIICFFPDETKYKMPKFTAVIS